MKMKVMNSTGHTTYVTDAPTEGETQLTPEQIEEEFNKLVHESRIAFEMESGSTTGKQMTKFNPDAEEIIVIAPIAGG